MRYFESLGPQKSVWGYRLGMLLLIVLALGVDLFLFQVPPRPTSLIAAAILSISSIIFLFWPRLGGWIYLLADAIFVALPSSSVGMLGYLCMAVIFLWGWRRYYVDAALAIILLAASFFNQCNQICFPQRAGDPKHFSQRQLRGIYDEKSGI